MHSVPSTGMPARGVRAWLSLLITGVAAAVLVVALTGCARTSADATTGSTSDAAAFFARYVTADGRVVRLDQNNDTVSEGQAYALLIAVTQNDAKRFATVWNWTRRNLLRPDGLLAWHWSGGKVVDPSTAKGPIRVRRAR